MEIIKITLSLAFLLFTTRSDYKIDEQFTRSPEQSSYKLSEAFPNVTFNLPVELTAPNDNTNRIFVVELRGVILVFPNASGTKNPTIFLDIEKQVSSGGEMGLLGLTFHPNYKTNGYFYVNYTTRNPLQTVVSRFKVSESNPNIADPTSETVLLRFDQPYDNHNGGKIAFGNDGFLYIATGDGGSWGDPKNNAQDRTELLGKMLRIDVNKTSGKLNYSIPADNPYVKSDEGYREEIYAYGLRNPWRFSFDRVTGLLWAGDVGQNKFEEIDIIEKGGNYGWRVMEANECYRSSSCNTSGLIEPIWSYAQGSETGNSVTGGYVCRDKSLPGLAGKYIYGDYVTGNIWALTYANKKAIKNELIAKISGGLPSFGEDGRRNLYVFSYNPGKIYRLVAQ